MYAGKKFTKPANYGREYGKHFSLQSKQGRQYESFISWGYRDKYDEVMQSTIRWSTEWTQPWVWFVQR